MTKIDIYSGFLGAGKTTLIKKLLSEAYVDLGLQDKTVIVNPIGCGDTAGAVWLSGMLNAMDFAESFSYALGAAMANAATMMPGSFYRSDAVNWAGAVKISFKTLF